MLGIFASIMLSQGTGTHGKVKEALAIESVASADPTTTTTVMDIQKVSVPESVTIKFDRLGVPPDLQPIFIAAGERTGIDPIILAAQVHLESGFTNHPCRIVNKGRRLQNNICGIAQQGNGWGTTEQRMDPNYAINRQADAIKEYLDLYNGNLDMAFRRYFSGRPTLGGSCGRVCRKYPGLVYNRVALAEGRR